MNAFVMTVSAETVSHVSMSMNVSKEFVLRIRNVQIQPVLILANVGSGSKVMEEVVMMSTNVK